MFFETSSYSETSDKAFLKVIADVPTQSSRAERDVNHTVCTCTNDSDMSNGILDTVDLPEENVALLFAQRWSDIDGYLTLAMSRFFYQLTKHWADKPDCLSGY